MTQRTRDSITVQNEAKRVHNVALNRVVYRIKGSYAFGDLLRLTEQLFELRPQMVEIAWEHAHSEVRTCNIVAVAYILRIEM